MTPEQIAKLREKLAKATPVPWHFTGHSVSMHWITPGPKPEPGTAGGRVIADTSRGQNYGHFSESEAKANAALIVAAVTALPALLDTAEAALGEGEYHCPKCGAAADERWDCCEAYEQTKKRGGGEAALGKGAVEDAADAMASRWVEVDPNATSFVADVGGNLFTLVQITPEERTKARIDPSIEGIPTMWARIDATHIDVWPRLRPGVKIIGRCKHEWLGRGCFACLEDRADRLEVELMQATNALRDLAEAAYDVSFIEGLGGGVERLRTARAKASATIMALDADYVPTKD